MYNIMYVYLLYMYIRVFLPYIQYACMYTGLHTEFGAENIEGSGLTVYPLFSPPSKCSPARGHYRIISFFSHFITFQLFAIMTGLLF